ncbi:hypothetical protein, partial [Staphylococcus aureus]|uniref:hypothetical protein n=1 Tax=Staphylococcus aureus TaxID=1280 RepID=UPI000F0E0B63
SGFKKFLTIFKNQNFLIFIIKNLIIYVVFFFFFFWFFFFFFFKKSVILDWERVGVGKRGGDYGDFWGGPVN